jgi:hypothetical protein
VIVSFSANAASRPFLRVPRNVLVDLNGLCRLGGLGEDSGCPTEAVEVHGYSLGVLSNALYVVKTDLTTFYRLANLRGGTIEFQLDLQLLEPIYLRDQPRRQDLSFLTCVRTLQAGASRLTPNWRPWFVNLSRCALIRRIRLRGATSRYRATWSRRDSPTRCANEGVATTRQGHGLVDPNGTAHALARTRHWCWYSYLPPCPIIPSKALPIIWQVGCDPRHNF